MIEDWGCNFFIKCMKVKSETNKIRNEKGEVTTDNAEIQRIIRDYYEQLYGNEMDNLKDAKDTR